MNLRIPKLNIYQLVLVILTVILVIACIAATLICFPSLPEKLPQHFDINGNANRYGGRGSVFLIPAINLGMFIMFAFLVLSPKILENPNTIRPLDPLSKPLIARETLNILIECGFLCTALFDYIQAFILAQKQLNTIGVWIIVGLLSVSSIYRSIGLSKYGLK